MAKVELGLARGKHTYDKRHALAEREAKRDIERALAPANDYHSSINNRSWG